MNYRTTVLTELFLIISSIILFFSYLKNKEMPYLVIFILIAVTAVILGVRIKLNKNDD